MNLRDFAMGRATGGGGANVLKELCEGTLTNIVIPNGTTEIKDRILAYKPFIESVDIPASVTKIGNFAFASDTGMKTIICRATTPPTLGSNPWANITVANLTVYVPSESLSAYKIASNWESVKDYMQPIPE